MLLLFPILVYHIILVQPLRRYPDHTFPSLRSQNTSVYPCDSETPLLRLRVRVLLTQTLEPQDLTAPDGGIAPSALSKDIDDFF